MVETVIICNPTIDKTDMLNKLKSIFSKVTDEVNMKDIGIKKLAYKIKNFSEGYYYLFTYEPSSDIPENKIDTILRTTDEVIKSLTIKIDDITDVFDDKDYITINLTENYTTKHVDALDVILGLNVY